MTKTATWKSILAGKRIAVTGFSKDDAADIREALEGCDALCRIVNEPLTLANSQTFDILVTRKNTDLVQEATESVSLKPRVLVGEFTDIAADMSAIAFPGCQFMLLPGSTHELLLRAATGLLSAGGLAPSRKRERSVLLADDDPSITALLKANLTRQNIVCHVAQDGERALALARECQPSVVVLDVNMPHTDGFEVLASLRNDPETRDMKVLMLTGCEQETDVVRGFGLGTDDYVTKPFNPMEVTARIRRLLAAA